MASNRFKKPDGGKEGDKPKDDKGPPAAKGKMKDRAAKRYAKKGVDKGDEKKD